MDKKVPWLTIDQWMINEQESLLIDQYVFSSEANQCEQ